MSPIEAAASDGFKLRSRLRSCFFRIETPMPAAHDRQRVDQRSPALAAGTDPVAAMVAKVELVNIGYASSVRQIVRLSAIRARHAAQSLRHQKMDLFLDAGQKELVRVPNLAVRSSVSDDRHHLSPSVRNAP